MSDRIAVAIALSTPLLREGIPLLLRDAAIEVCEVVATASQLLRPECADVALVNFEGSAPGREELTALRRRAPALRIVGLHDELPRRHLDRAGDVGVSALVDVAAGATTLLAALRGDHAGMRRRWSPPRVARAPLRERERDVLTLVANGASTREAADRLSIKPHVAERVMQDLLRKLDASNRAQAVAIALRDGLLDGHPGEAPSA